MFLMHRSRSILFHGKPCPFCRRAMDHDDMALQPTRDHHPVPQSRGGRRTIICCKSCNNFKGDMSADQWYAFMIAYPGWWAMARSVRRRGLRVIKMAEKPSTPMANPLKGLARQIEKSGGVFDHNTHQMNRIIAPRVSPNFNPRKE